MAAFAIRVLSQFPHFVPTAWAAFKPRISTRDAEHAADLVRQAAIVPGAVCQRTVEHVFGTLKAWMGSTHFLTKTLPRVRTETSLQVLAYNCSERSRSLGLRT